MVCDHCYCGWCGPSTFCPGGLCPQGLELWETCSLAYWMAKWFTAMSASSLEGVLKGLAISFPRRLSLVAVCTDDMVMQFMLTMLIIDHFAAVHQCLDVCNVILGVLSQPGYYLFEFSKMHMGVDVMCHSLLDSVK